MKRHVQGWEERRIRLGGFGLFGVLLALLLLRSVVLADMGTPLLWAPLTQLLFGNALIGVLEGLLIAVVFRVRKLFPVVLMIAANYVSMWCGLAVLPSLREYVSGVYLSEAPLYKAIPLLWMLGIAVFGLTIAIDWPFCLLALWRKAGKWWKSVAASVLVQTASYALLILCYGGVSTVSLYQQVDVDPSFVPSVRAPGWVYFISRNDGDVHRIRLNGTGSERVLKLGARDRDPRLFLRLNETETELDLWGHSKAIINVDNQRVLLPGVAPARDSDFYRGLQASDWEIGFPERGFGGAPDLRPADERDWSVRTGPWGNELIDARNEKTNESLRLGFETPFLALYARRLTILPDDLVVFQLLTGYQMAGGSRSTGIPEQVVLLDLRARKLGLITIGCSPVVVVPDEAESPDSESLPPPRQSSASRAAEQVGFVADDF